MFTVSAFCLQNGVRCNNLCRNCNADETREIRIDSFFTYDIVYVYKLQNVFSKSIVRPDVYYNNFFLWNSHIAMKYLVKINWLIKKNLYYSQNLSHNLISESPSKPYRFSNWICDRPAVAAVRRRLVRGSKEREKIESWYNDRVPLRNVITLRTIVLGFWLYECH